MLLESQRIDIAEELKMDLFAISLLHATIQNSGIEESVPIFYRP